MRLQAVMIVYYIVCNLTLFILMGVDKSQAVRQKRRISERALLLWGAISGGFGGLLGMSVWRHKTRKWYFWLVFLLSLAGHLYLWGHFLL